MEFRFAFVICAKPRPRAAYIFDTGEENFSLQILQGQILRRKILLVLFKIDRKHGGFFPKTITKYIRNEGNGTEGA